VALLKMMTMSAVDLLSEWFESERLIAPMSVSGIIGTFLGVRSPGTAYVLLHHYMGEIDGSYRAWGLPKGGTGAIAEAIARAARAASDPFNSPWQTLSAGARSRRAREQRRDPRQMISGLDPNRTFLG
jgi:phytoene dehydrogenase-like protein